MPYVQRNEAGDIIGEFSNMQDFAQEWVDEVPPKKETAQDKIIALESTVTQRRLRDAMLGNDNGWLADVELKIKKLRNK